MAEKITYTDKESLVTDPTIDEKNKVTDANMNEIKNSVNANADQLDETIVIGDDNITNNTKEVINEVDYIPYINSEIAIGPTNPQNQRTWFKQNEKNLLNLNISHYTIGSSGQEVTDNPNIRITFNYINIKANTSIVFSCKQSETATIIGIAYYDDNKTFISRSLASSTNIVTGTTPTTCKYVRPFISGFNSEVSSINQYEMQLEYGTSRTTFEEVINTSINIDEQDIYNKPVVLVTTQNVTYDSSSQDGSAVFTLQFPTGFNASNTIVVALGWKYHSDTNNEWRFGTIAGSDVKPNPFFVTFNYNNTPGIRVRFDDVEAEVTYSADFKIVLMKVD